MVVKTQATLPQSIFLNLRHKFRAFVGGYGSGKSYVGSMALCSHSWKYPKVNSGYFAPTYSQIRDIFFPTIEEVAFNMGLKVDIKEGNKEVHYFSGRQFRSTTICRSMDKPGSIVGFKIGHALCDELDTMPTNKAENAWRKIIARMRYKIDGLSNGVDVTTTPEGFKFVYKKFVLERTESYGLVKASTYDNEINLPPDYIPTLKETYPENVSSAYLNGEFVNMTSGSVYRDYDRKKHDSMRMVKDGEPLYIGQDFNVGNMSSAICVRDDRSFVCVDQLIGIFDTPALIKSLQEKYPNRKIYIYPDASGSSRKTVNASVSDISLLSAAGYNVRVNGSNPAVKDRILSINKAFQDGKLRINSAKCKNVSESLEKQCYDENGEPDKSAGYDHMNDALGYLVCFEMPVVKPIIIPGIGMAH